MSKLSNLYFGRSGEFHVMSEFLYRGWNVAIPEVDIGNDVFVIKDSTGDYTSIQVKSSNVKSHNYGYSATYSLNYDQLTTPVDPELYYFFLSRYNDQWNFLAIISRTDLEDLHTQNNVGTLNGSNVILNLRYFENNTPPSLLGTHNYDLTHFMNDWTPWPIIPH